ncbi:Endo-1,3-beta-glucanase OS=Streptomyces fumanus OX=67302 GN=GCM10018772_33690 PE=3 SV=1 [Streptomyces fumanus]
MPNVTGAAAKGYWPAFWMLGSPFRGNYWNWPGVGELDIMENVQGLNTVWATMHCGTNPDGPCNETTGIGGSTSCPGSTCQSGFHTYRMEWDRSTSPEQIRFSVDGVTHHTVRADQMDAATWSNATNHGFFIILNVAMGGGFPGAFGGGPDGGTEPGHPMVVDYVQARRPAAATASPATATPTAPSRPSPTTPSPG